MGRKTPPAGSGTNIEGERAPSLRSLVFGEETERVAAETVGPVVAVRRDESRE